MQVITSARKLSTHSVPVYLPHSRTITTQHIYIKCIYIGDFVQGYMSTLKIQKEYVVYKMGA